MVYQDARRSDKQPVVCHKRDPSTLFISDDQNSDDQENVSSNVWSIHMFRSNAPASDNRSTVQETQPSTRILVIGAGYAGLLFTMRLAGKVARQNVHIALVNESDTFTERPRLHQFATNQRGPMALSSTDAASKRTSSLFRDESPVSTLHTMRSLVVDQQHTHQLKYDYLVYALGSATDRKTVPGVAEYAYTLAASGPLSAAALRETLPSVQARHGHVVVSGGGATGIETAAEVASAYPHIKVHLVTQGSFGSLPGQERGQLDPAATRAPGSRDHRSDQCDSRARTQCGHRPRKRARL